MMIDLYKILEVLKDATPREIKKAYRDLAKELHPDKNGGIEDPRMADLSRAYSILSDKALRAEYDSTGIASTQEQKDAHVENTLKLYFTEVLKNRKITGPKLVNIVLAYAKSKSDDFDLTLLTEEKHLKNLELIKSKKFRDIKERESLGFAISISIEETELTIYNIKEAREVNNLVIDRITEFYTDEDDEMIATRSPRFNPDEIFRQRTPTQSW